jgi:hypothetical protein
MKINLRSHKTGIGIGIYFRPIEWLWRWDWYSLYRWTNPRADYCYKGNQVRLLDIGMITIAVEEKRKHPIRWYSTNEQKYRRENWKKFAKDDERRLARYNKQEKKWNKKYGTKNV